MSNYYLCGPTIYVIRYCSEWQQGWDWQFDAWFWNGIHSSSRDRTSWQSIQYECFDSKSKCPCCWRRDFTQLRTRDKQKEEKAGRKYCFSILLRELPSLGRILNQFDESASAFDIYEEIINLDSLIEFLVQQNNLYLQQNERNFLASTEEMKAFIGVN